MTWSWYKLGGSGVGSGGGSGGNWGGSALVGWFHEFYLRKTACPMNLGVRVFGYDVMIDSNLKQGSTAVS